MTPCLWKYNVQYIKQVLSCHPTNQFYLKGEKYEFHVSTISFLQYIIGPKGVAKDAAKLVAVTE